MNTLNLKANRAISLIFSVALFSFSLAHVSTNAAALLPESARANIEQLDSDFQELNNEYLLQYTKHRPAQRYRNSAQLFDAVLNETNPSQISALIRENIHQLVRNASVEEFSSLLEHLYNNNDTATIRDVTRAVNDANDDEKISRNYFLLAKYYYKRGNWTGLKAALSNVKPKVLSRGDSHYYLLLMGYSLQGSKEHRKSVSYYKKIPKSSPYYPHAKLNEGIAYLRQGWWTEAHMEFTDAIENLKANKQLDAEAADFANRIQVVLGFSKIDNEFYRDARRALRKVDLDSAYTNKAMIGLGIAAAHQKDFPGALNIFEILVQKQPRDKNVDEAYLLVPYGHEELGDFVNASIKYQQAIQYYQSRLTKLTEAAQQLNRAPDDVVITVIKQLDSNDIELYDQLNIIPQYFLDNYDNLLKMRNSRVSQKTASSVQHLLTRYKQQIKSITAHNIQVRTTAINSYLSQAQFGVAKLYDQE